MFVNSCGEIFSEAYSALDSQIELLEEALREKKHRYVFVPDTNALINNPTLENWYFDNIDEFWILLLPTVLSELDDLKINHRNEAVREKCNSLIRKLKEYRRRGRLNEGVPIIKNRIYVKSKATEPDFNNSLSWLDPENKDDRIIARFLEVIREQINTSVILVTSDINLQSKLEFVIC
ncbi:MAG: PIN domain-containing protein [Cyanobacteria bacterium P01_A01_bin.40]